MSLCIQHLGYAYVYRNLAALKEAMRATGEEIENNGLPQALVPLTFVFTSTGHVAQVRAHTHTHVALRVRGHFRRT